MIRKIKTFTNVWLIWHEIIVESGTNKSLPGIEIIWLPDATIKESKERIKSTLRNTDIKVPNIKFVLNLSPSDIRKNGTSFDLPMAVAIFCTIYEDIQNNLLDQWLFFGELGLDWEVKRIDGLLPMVLGAKKKWYKYFFVPQDNLYELEYIQDIYICPINNFKDIVEIFANNQEPSWIHNNKSLNQLKNDYHFQVDFEHIKWHTIAKRALSIAATGMHNVLMSWAPWSGKTMLSKALQSILPPMSYDEILEVSQIYSVVWKLDKENPLIVHRPFRPIHHTASKISVTWWWSNLRPWEISLSHRGILFLDEIAEFPMDVLEVLRQPIEDKTITINRVSGSISYPASFMLVAAMNPCKCGYYKDKEKNCICSINDIKRYQSRLSWPLLDRIDMILEIPREHIDQILDRSSWLTSTQIREQVLKARGIQQKRFDNTSINTNSQISSKDIQKYIILEDQAEVFLKNATQQLTLSPRVVHRTMKLARSIADIEWSDIVKTNHIAESLQYRSKTMFVES